MKIFKTTAKHAIHLLLVVSIIFIDISGSNACRESEHSVTSPESCVPNRNDYFPEEESGLEKKSRCNPKLFHEDKHHPAIAGENQYIENSSEQKPLSLQCCPEDNFGSCWCCTDRQDNTDQYKINNIASVLLRLHFMCMAMVTLLIQSDVGTTAPFARPSPIQHNTDIPLYLQNLTLII